ncbi:MAG: ABC transporter substrate-binding protein [Sulfolobales archaeon]
MVARNVALTLVVALMMLAAGFGVGTYLAGGTATTAIITEIKTTTVVFTERITELTTVVMPEARISVVDALGREITFDKPPTRVVSLAPSITEMLFALGLQDRIVGVTSYCNYPPEVQQLVSKGDITIIGGFWTPDLEKIVSLRPDLVIGSAGTPPHLRLKESLEQAGIKVFYIKATAAINKYDVYSDIRVLAKIFRVEIAAEELVNRIEVDMEFVEKSIPKDVKPKVLVLLGPPAWGLYSAGGNTFISWLITTAGGVNIAAKFTGWPMLDYEFILSHDPDVIIVSAMGSNYTILSKEIAETPLAQTKAFKTGRVYLVDQEANDILVRPGPRLGLALRMLASILFPDTFGEPKVPTVYRISEGTDSITSAGSTIRLSTVGTTTHEVVTI